MPGVLEPAGDEHESRLEVAPNLALFDIFKNQPRTLVMVRVRVGVGARAGARVGLRLRLGLLG